MTGRHTSSPAGGADLDAVGAAAAVLGPIGQLDGPLGALTTYRVGGPAAIVVRVTHEADLVLVAEARRASGLPVLVVGRGSNLLVADDGFGGIAVVMDPGGLDDVTISGTTIRAGAAVPLPALARRSADAGLSGLEWAVGVPGSVGGGIRMNAGGHGSEMSRTVRSARVVDLATGASDRMAADLAFGYRRSSLRPTDVVTAATFELEPGDRERSLGEIREIVRWRRAHQPGGQNAGSVFTNPDGLHTAGWLIEAAGLKGHRLGTATVSDIHANFIQADPGGSADDVFHLMQFVQATIRRRHSIELRSEIRLVGFAAPDEPDPNPNPHVHVEEEDEP
jgi:UDP-N-acetylmuramate dehydrogenase